MAAVDFGVDIGKANSAGFGWDHVTGVAVVANRILRRLQTPRGRLHYAPDFGLEVRQMVEQALDARGVLRWQEQIARECEKDEAIERAKAAVTLNAATSTATITISLTTAAGPFRLVVSVSALTVELLEAA